MAHVLAPPPDFIGLSVSSLAPVRPKDPVPGEGPEGEVAALVITLPGTVSPGQALAAEYGHTVIDDYYDAIHVRPSLLALGNITATVVRQIEVWNAHFDDRVLDSLDVTAGDGIEVFGPTLPHTLSLLASALFTVEVSPNGPAAVDARFDLVFTTPEADPHWRITGLRIVQWTIPPNWRQPFGETLRYRTEVLIADDGTEQRIGLRQLPRRDLAFTPLVNGQAKRDFQRLLATWQHRTYAMADWARSVAMAGMPAGGQIVTLLEPMPELVVGQLLVVRYSDVRTQAIEVEEISPDGLTVTLNSPVAEAYPVGSRAYPGLIVHAEQRLSSRRLSSDVATAEVAFREMWKTGLPAQGAPELTWRGREVLLRPPNWVQPLEHEHEYPFEWLDSRKGAFDYRTPQEAPKDVRRLHYTLEGREEIRWWMQWFARVRGRRGEFYAPTWDRDIEVRASLLEGSFQLPIDDAQEIGRPANDRVYRNVCVRLRDGDVLLREVITGEMSQTGPALILDAGWPRSITPEEILAIHYMPRWRSATDEMTVRWITDGVAQISLAWQTLRDDQ